MTEVSFVKRCYETETRPISLDDVFYVIKTGDKGLKGKITQIRNRFESEMTLTMGDRDKAKKIVAELKNELPGFLPSGLFSKRENGALERYSGLLCADLDSVGEERIPQVKALLATLPFVRAIALSPSGDGLKVFFNVVNDPTRHGDSFRSIRDNIRDALELEIDEKCKDPARICFFTYDPDLWVRAEGNEPIPPADPEPVKSAFANREAPPDLSSRERIAFSLLGELRPAPEKGGYFVRCPGETFHTQKDGPKHTMLYLDGAPTLDCKHTSCAHVVAMFNEKLRREIGKLEWQQNEGFSTSTHPYRGSGKWKNFDKPNGDKPLTPEKPLIEICTVDDLENYVAPPGIQLVGDYHITADTGFVFVIGGQASVGKSLAIVWLGVAGSRGDGEYFGMPVHRKFKVLVIQNENGLFRLSRIIKELGCKELKDHLFFTKPPPYGMLFRRGDFRAQVVAMIEKFQPDIVVLDPWNSVARDQEQGTYLETFEVLKSVLPPDTVLGILCHTRKPQKDEDRQGRGLMHVIAGSHVLTSVPRTVFVMQHASDDVEEDRVVWTCCKNNDGELGKASAWFRRPSGVFDSVPNFDWATFYGPSRGKGVTINEDMIIETFEEGPLVRSLARDKLLEISGAHKTAVYNALSEKGRFSDILIFHGKNIDCLKRGASNDSST